MTDQPAPSSNETDPDTTGVDADEVTTDAPAPTADAPAPTADAPVPAVDTPDEPDSDDMQSDTPDEPDSDDVESDTPDEPDSDDMESDAPESDAPESDAPESDAPESDAPESDAPASDAPASDDSDDDDETAGATPNETESNTTDHHGDTGDTGDSGDTDEDGTEDDESRRKSAEEFAREHDPANHDIAAGADARQPGDWTADDSGGPQVWDADGNLIEGEPVGAASSAATPSGAGGGPDADSEQGSAGERRTSSFDEVSDGGYSVGSAAVIDDGAMPLGHPVKAWEDSKTFVEPGRAGYEDHEPQVWFTDVDAAQNAGFSRAGTDD